MNKTLKLASMLMMAALMVLSISCNGPHRMGKKLQCTYTPGTSEKVSFAATDLYRNWVEMAGKDTPGQESMRSIRQQVVMTRDVTAVDDAGNATMNVTLDDVTITFTKTLQGQTTERSYHSTAAETKSDWGDAEPLGGLSYTIKIAPNTEVLEIVGLEKLRSQAGVDENEKGAVASILSDEFIRKCHERDFLTNGLKLGQTLDVTDEVPNVMIKAQALKKTYIGVIDEENNVVNILVTGEPVHVLPEGMAEPEEPRDWGRSLIKDKSDMNDIKISGLAQINTATGQVTRDMMNVEATLILLEENVFPDKTPQEEKEPSGNVMFTKVKNSWEFNVVE